MAKAFPNTGVTIVDTSADLPTPSAALEGVMMFQKDTNELKICDGSSWRSVANTDTPSSLVLITPASVNGAGVSVSNGVVTFSAATNVSINGIFTPAFKNYRVIWNWVSNSTSAQNCRFRLRYAGGDYDNNYYNSLWYLQGTTFVNGANSNVANSEWMFYHSDLLCCGAADFYQPNEATTTNIIGNFSAWGSVDNIRGQSQIWQYASRVYDGFSVFPSNAAHNLTGTIRVYGYRNSI